MLFVSGNFPSFDYLIQLMFAYIDVNEINSYVIFPLLAGYRCTFGGAAPFQKNKATNLIWFQAKFIVPHLSLVGKFKILQCNEVR